MANTALSLVGFMDEEEAHAYLLKTCRLRPEYRNPQALTATWHAARQQLGTSIARAGFPNIQPIPEDQREHLQRVMAHPRFMNPINGMDVDFALVEIEPLLAFQQHIWLERCDELCRRVSTNPPLEELMRVCLPEQLQPISHEVEIQRSSQAGQVTIVIKDLDIETQSLAVYPANDPSAHVIGFRNRRRLPYVQVVRFNGRCYLRNGFHRVYGVESGMICKKGPARCAG